MDWMRHMPVLALCALLYAIDKTLNDNPKGWDL